MRSIDLSKLLRASSKHYDEVQAVIKASSSRTGRIKIGMVTTLDVEPGIKSIVAEAMPQEFTPSVIAAAFLDFPEIACREYGADDIGHAVKSAVAEAVTGRAMASLSGRLVREFRSYSLDKLDAILFAAWLSVRMDGNTPYQDLGEHLSDFRAEQTLETFMDLQHSLAGLSQAAKVSISQGEARFAPIARAIDEALAYTTLITSGAIDLDDALASYEAYGPSSRTKISYDETWHIPAEAGPGIGTSIWDQCKTLFSALEQSSLYDALDEETVFPNGKSFNICTNWARLAQEYFGKDRSVVVGFLHDSNPDAATSASAGGHDFLLLDDRFIVDGWVLGSGLIADDAAHPGVYDLQVMSDTAEISRLYGKQEAWLPLDTLNQSGPKM